MSACCKCPLPSTRNRLLSSGTYHEVYYFQGLSRLVCNSALPLELSQDQTSPFLHALLTKVAFIKELSFCSLPSFFSISLS